MKTKTLIRILIFTGILVIAGLLFMRYLVPARWQGQTPRARVSIALGFRPGVATDLGLLQAIERGEPAKQGFDMTLKPYVRDDAALATLKSGQPDTLSYLSSF